MLFLKCCFYKTLFRLVYIQQNIKINRDVQEKKTSILGIRHFQMQLKNKRNN